MKSSVWMVPLISLMLWLVPWSYFASLCPYTQCLWQLFFLFFLLYLSGTSLLYWTCFLLGWAFYKGGRCPIHQGRIEGAGVASRPGVYISWGVFLWHNLWGEGMAGGFKWGQQGSRYDGSRGSNTWGRRRAIHKTLEHGASCIYAERV